MAHRVLCASTVRVAHLLTLVLLDVVVARPAWCESAARPSTVVGALIEGDPANDAVEAAAQDIAATLRIERTSHARIWRANARDEYAAPPVNELADAMREVYELCPGPVAPASLLPDAANALQHAASTLARVTGEQPDYRGTVATQSWQAYLDAAETAAACVSRGQAPEHVNVTIFARGDRTWTLYANGVDAGAGTGDGAAQISVQPGQEVYVHARCAHNVRCSRTIRVKDASRAIGVHIDAVGARLHGRMSDGALSVSYPSAADRNKEAARDAALAAYVLAAAHTPRGDAISVMSEGPDFRLVYANDDGVPIRTLRASREAVTGAAQRLVDGDTEPTVGAWQPGKHRVVVQLGAGAPTVSDAQANFDRGLVPTRPFCTAGRCAFAAPPGKLRMRFDEVQWSGPLEKQVELGKDLLVTVQPGRRYWAKYTGMGMITVGAAGMAAAVLSGGLKTALANGVCEAASGPAECDEHVPASKWETAAFFGGLGTVAVGTVFYLVVHKKPRIRVSPLGGTGLAF